MYYRKHIPAPRTRRARRSIIAITLVLLFLAINAGLHPIIETMLIAQARNAFTQAVNSAVRTAAAQQGGEGFVVLLQNTEGEITSAQADTAAINTFNASLGEQLVDEMKKLENDPILVPIGTLTGIDILTGRGPRVELRLVQNGSVTSELVSTFSEAGINQTCHTIECLVEAKFFAVIPGFRTPVTLEASVIVAQSVIVGSVPDSYTCVYGDQSDTVGRIFDYGDPYGEDVKQP